MNARSQHSNPRAQGTNPRARAREQVELLRLAIDQALEAMDDSKAWSTDLTRAKQTLEAALDATS